MPRKRLYIDDVSYGEAHRHSLPELYSRRGLGHRLDMADRDWTEYCHWCKMPLAIIETVRDKGQDITDKNVSATKQLAALSGLPSYLVAWRVDRAISLQKEIDKLGNRLMELMTMNPIKEFRVLPITRYDGERRAIHIYEPCEWWHEVLLMHRSHHAKCGAAMDKEVPVKRRELEDAESKSVIHRPSQMHLFR